MHTHIHTYIDGISMHVRKYVHIYTFYSNLMPSFSHVSRIDLQGQRMVPAYSTGGETSGLPSPEWLKRFWKFVGHDNMHLFNAWPVVLLTTGALASVSAMSEVLNLPQALPAYMPPYVDEDARAQV
jgi:hypothetical protein